MQFPRMRKQIMVFKTELLIATTLPLRDRDRRTLKQTYDKVLSSRVKMQKILKKAVKLRKWESRLENLQLLEVITGWLEEDS